MGISRSAALTALVALSFGWLACSGEDDGTGKGTGAATAAGSAGAAGSGTLGIGGRAGGGAGGSDGGSGGDSGASAFCLPANPAPTPATCDGTAPKNLAFLTLAPMPFAVPLPTAHALSTRPNVIVVRSRGGQLPLVVGRIDGGIATWVTSEDKGAFDQIGASAVLGDDLWVTSGYQPHHLWRCTIGDDLRASCVDKGEFPHEHANGSIFPVPAGSCEHPQGALLDIDTPADGEPIAQLHDAHLYDIATGVWTNVPRPTGERRDLSQIIRLRDGRAWFVGGDDGTTPVATTEIFDGKSIVAGPKLNNGRLGQGMALFPDGRVLVSGGYGDDAPFPSWEIVDVVAGTITASPQPPGDNRGRGFARTTGLFGGCGYVSLGGRVPGGGAPLDYFAFDAPGFEAIAMPPLPAPVEYGAAVTLPDGSLVYVGGRTPGIEGGPEGEWHGDAFRLFSAP